MREIWGVFYVILSIFFNLSANIYSISSHCSHLRLLLINQTFHIETVSVCVYARILIYVCFCSLQPVVTTLPEESGGAGVA